MQYFNRAKHLFLVFVLASCSSDEGSTTTEPDKVLTSKELEFIEEYEYVTFNLAPDTFGADKNEKWKSDIRIFLDGATTNDYREAVVASLEALSGLFGDALDCYLVNTVEESNVHLILGEKQAIETVWPDMFDRIGQIDFKGYALYNGNGAYAITKGRIWVKNASIALFEHELGHVIGLGHASGGFCQGDIDSNRSFMCSFLKKDFSVFDKAIIQTLYHPKIEAGKTFPELRPIVEELLLTDGILVE